MSNSDDVLQVDYEGLKSLIEASEKNSDVFNRLAYLWDDLARNQNHFVLINEDKKIIAVGSVQAPESSPEELWITHISVDPEYKNKGHGKNILGSIFNFAANTNYILSPSSFEPEGFKCLAHVMPRLHQQYPHLKIRYKTLFGDIVDGTQPYRLIKPHSTLQIEKDFTSSTEQHTSSELGPSISRSWINRLKEKLLSLG